MLAEDDLSARCKEREQCIKVASERSWGDDLPHHLSLLLNHNGQDEQRQHIVRLGGESSRCLLHRDSGSDNDQAQSRAEEPRTVKREQGRSKMRSRSSSLAKKS